MNTQLCTVRIETLGCRLNQAEAESFAALCTEAGFSIYTDHTDKRIRNTLTTASEHQKTVFSIGTEQHSTAIRPLPLARAVPHNNKSFLFTFSESWKPAGLCAALPPEQTVLCFVNTCTVTGKAEQKARRLIRLLTRVHPYAVILVTGCYAQLEQARIEALHPHVLTFPGQQKDLLTAIPAYLAALVQESAYFDTAFFLSALSARLTGLRTGTVRQLPIHHQAMHTRQEKQLFALSSPKFLFHSRALLKIQDGCNDACAYCRIRLARGKSVSLPASEVIERIHCIEQTGIFEVTLTGVNLSQYRSGAGDFADLLTLILEKSAIRIRISSLYPDRIDEALVPVLAHPRICPHFHLSVQSGSDTVLKAMHRAYRSDTVYHAVSELRRIKDNPFIGADIIVGFPGETEHDFEQTYRMCSELSFAGIHVFPFSARPGTAAWDIHPKVPERITSVRIKALSTLAEKHSTAYMQAWDGKLLYGVVESPRSGAKTVITENYLSLPLLQGYHPDEDCLQGGEYVQVLVQGKNAALADIVSRPAQSI